MNATREPASRIDQLTAELTAQMAHVWAVLKKCEAKLKTVVRSQEQGQVEAVRLLTFEIKMLLAENSDSYAVIDARLTDARALIASLEHHGLRAGSDESRRAEWIAALHSADRGLLHLECELADVAAISRAACEKLERSVSQRDIAMTASIFERLMGQVGRRSP
jgi:hypothetical protein